MPTERWLSEDGKAIRKPVTPMSASAGAKAGPGAIISITFA